MVFAMDTIENSSFEADMGELLVLGLASYDQKQSEASYPSAEVMLNHERESVYEALGFDPNETIEPLVTSDEDVIDLDEFMEALNSYVPWPDVEEQLDALCLAATSFPTPPRSPTPPLPDSDSSSSDDDFVPLSKSRNLVVQSIAALPSAFFPGKKISKPFVPTKRIPKIAKKVPPLRIIIPRSEEERLVDCLMKDLSVDNSHHDLPEFKTIIIKDEIFKTDWLEKFVSCMSSSLRKDVPYCISRKNKSADTDLVSKYVKQRCDNEKKRIKFKTNNAQLSFDAMMVKAREISQKKFGIKRHLGSPEKVPLAKRRFIDKVNRSIDHPLVIYARNRRMNVAANVAVQDGIEQVGRSPFTDFYFANLDTREGIISVMACLTMKVTKVKRQYGAEGMAEMCRVASEDDPPRFANRQAYVCYGIAPDYDTKNSLVPAEYEPNAWLGVSGREKIDAWKGRSGHVNEMFNNARIQGVSEMTVMVQNVAHLYMYHIGSRLGDTNVTRREMVDKSNKCDLIVRRPHRRDKRPLTRFILHMQETRNRTITIDDVDDVPLEDDIEQPSPIVATIEQSSNSGSTTPDVDHQPSPPVNPGYEPNNMPRMQRYGGYANVLTHGMSPLCSGESLPNMNVLLTPQGLAPPSQFIGPPF